jgi:hypothetical protein
VAAVAIVACATVAAPVAAAGAPPAASVDAGLPLPPGAVAGGDIAGHFIGISVEWTLTDRYMGANTRAAFVNLLRNLGSGVLRVGGSSQDQVPFDATAPDSDRYVTPDDLARIRATLDQLDAGDPSTPAWVTVLGTAMAPPTSAFPWRSADRAVAFARDGVAPVFGDEAGRREVAGISLGNEPDLTYSGDLARYLGDLPAYVDADAVDDWPLEMPATSEPIGPWQDLERPPPGFETRWFWDWPTILGAVAPALVQRPGALGPTATDHFYPLARNCSADTRYRCPSIERLLDPERMDNFGFEVYTHASQAAGLGLRYRMDETNTAAARGAPGVSDVAASATWTLDTLFNAACPQPPDHPGANAACQIGATGVNVHNSERNAFFKPEEGNAYYNAIRYDPTARAGAPTPGPSYYALLLFAQLAEGTTGLRPVALDGSVPVAAWEVRAGAQRRLFLINNGAAPATVEVRTRAERVTTDRMTPYDPTGAGRTLDAPDVRVDGQAVAPDGTFPGLAPTTAGSSGGRLPVAIAPGEAVVLTMAPDGLSREGRRRARSPRSAPCRRRSAVCPRHRSAPSRRAPPQRTG